MVGENSYSVCQYETLERAVLELTWKHHNDHDIGVAIIDAYTHFILAYLETIVKTSKATLQDFVRLSPPQEEKVTRKLTLYPSSTRMIQQR